jgi:ribA/ribD-fused uncharacterized protein
MNDKFVFFWDGPLSQWHRSYFEVDEVKYNCAEQFMMASKAKVFGDKEAQAKIMESIQPMDQKAIGRGVKNFSVRMWSQMSRDVVYIGNMAKFGQNADLREYLLSTGDREIVEASPYDTIWGIGMGEGDPDRFDKSKWKGLNWLGEVLMRVRKDLRIK